jgi:eukaryotic-like serine/threonine-protein kinase
MKRRSSTSRQLQTWFLGWGRLVLLGGVLVTIFILSSIVGMRLAVRGHELETPSALGMQLEEAQRLFSSLNLNLTVTGKRYDPVIPEGAVVSQVPGPGVGIKANRDVRVIVSLGVQTNPVPELQGVTLRAARMVADQEGYAIDTVSEIGLEGEEGVVLAQWPEADSEAGVDDRISVLVTAPHKPTYVMPNLIGMNINRVLILLNEREFERKIFYRREAGFTRGMVVRQFPEPGYPIREGETINLEVAR